MAGLALALVLTGAGIPAHAVAPDDLPPALRPAGPALADLDTRAAVPAAAPTSAAQELAEALDATVRWTAFGTAASVIRSEGYLATGVPGATPADAALTWLDQHRALYGLESAANLAVDTVVPLTDTAYAVVLRQSVSGLPVAPEGVATVGLSVDPDGGWRVAYASSTLVPETTARLTAGIRLTTAQAVAQAVDDAGGDAAPTDVRSLGRRGDWHVVQVAGLVPEQLVRWVAFPTPDGRIHPAYEVHYLAGPEEGYRYIVDASTGQVRYRENIVHHLDHEGTWDVYPSHPPAISSGQPPWRYLDADLRERWCWTAQPGCDRVIANDAARVPWDVDARTGEPTYTTRGNAVEAAEYWSGTWGQYPTSPTRDYQFPWTNVWYTTGCHPTNLVPGGNDIYASVTNLFVANWRMHDWAYHLGFTEQTWNAQTYNFGVNPAGEGDPVVALAQAGAISPGSRNNATMATRPDGTPSVMSMFLWEPAAASFYGPCAIGDFDMSVIGHEYTHMIENRLIGKGNTRSGFHAGAMGESWSDFIGLEYQHQYGLPRGLDAWTVGSYATGNPFRGIRNYNMAFPSAGQFPQPGQDVWINTLNFGSMGYDITGPQVHSDSQIWSAVNHDLRKLFLERYPNEGGTVQRECADGARPVEQCPGNRRWIQLVFDAMLLMPTAPTMLDARDAYFAADLLRFDGANHDLLWLGFARRGFGEHASVAGPADTDPVPSFESPRHEPATLHFVAVAKDEGGQPIEADVYVGNYEARATPIGQVERFVPHPHGYQFVARADGYGHVRFLVTDLQPGEERTITIHFPTNVASVAQGATATGDGVRHTDLIDDTEATNWQRAGDLPHLVTIDPPSAAAGRYGASGATFGPDPDEVGLAGPVVLVNDGSANPTEGCGPLVDFPAGAIALVDRGNCAFTEKVRYAQDAGAVAVIVINNVPGAPIEMGGSDPEVAIPAVMVSLADGDTIRSGLPATGRVATPSTQPVAGTTVVVALDGEQTIQRANVSAMLLPDQNRFTAVRQFELYACTAGDPANPTCDADTDAGWQRILRSHPDAFPGPNPRPSSPDLLLRSFALPTTTATHVKFVVLTNQCTGNPDFQGGPHYPEALDADCRDTAVGSSEVRAAELQLLTSQPVVDGAARVG